MSWGFEYQPYIKLSCWQEEKTDFLPLGVFAAKQKQELQEPTVDQDVLNVLKSFMAESRVEWHRLEQRVAILGMRQPRQVTEREREFFVDNLLVRIHFIIVMVRWTGLAPWEFESPFPCSLR